MKYRFLVATTICLLLLTLSVAYADPIRIMPLGDSITLGSNASVTDNNYRVGYRQKLYLDLVNGGYNIAFVGSLSSGMLAQPAFDIHHEGHGGWCADGCYAPYYDIRDYVFTFLTNNPADVVLLHIGTNDISGNHENAAEVGGILDEIYRYSSEITVVLARIISRLDGKALQTTTFNNAVEALARSRPEYGDTLILVDMESALNYPGDMDDLLHPNQVGYNKMADVWFNKLVTFLPSPAILTIQKSGTGQGTVTSVPVRIDCGSTCSASFSEGTLITLTALVDPGSVFTSWTGCDSVNGSTCTVAMTTNISVTALFTDVPNDFNSDGKPDILWRNTTSGDNVVWYMNGIAYSGSGWLPTLSDLTWTIAGIADFNSDGKPDILWRNTTSGDNVVWYMNGIAYSGNDWLEAVGDLTWTIAGIADFNSDGKPDILWRNTSDGHVAIWCMNGVNYTSVTPGYVADLTWTILGR
jgi:hypothetical protein